MQTKDKHALLAEDPAGIHTVKENIHILLMIILVPGLLCLTESCSSGSKQESTSSPKFTQYYNQGEELYVNNCSNCHQKNGTGLARVYPPLATSDYVSNHPDEVVCLIRYGKHGELVVNGITFNQPMPGIPDLTDLEIAEIVTYLYNTWGREKGMIDVKEIRNILKNCPDSVYTRHRPGH